MKRMIVLCMGILLVCTAITSAATIKVEKGLVVCIGEKALESVSADWKKPNCIFHCLETSEEKVNSLRKKLLDKGLYGKVSVAQFDGKNLPYINNLVNLYIAGSASKVKSSEVQRVLAPYGISIINGKKTMKPYPKNIDEWHQWLHGADNNAVAKDTVVGPPRHVQWISGPAWTRSHMGAPTMVSMVSSKGRLFTIEDTTTAENPFLPSKWTLFARNAFNGIILWTLDYPDWQSITTYIKIFPVQMLRRLIAVGDKVYCTPGLTAPVTVLDAATGKVLQKYKGTENTQEIVYDNGRLFCVVGDYMTSAQKKGGKSKKGKKGKKKKTGSDLPFKGYGFDWSAYNPQRAGVDEPKNVIIAIDVKTGKQLWKSKEIPSYIGTTMAIKDNKLVYQSTSGVMCLNASTGKKEWSVDKKIPYGRPPAPNTLVLSKEAVYSDEGGTLYTYTLAGGKDYWGTTIDVPRGYFAPRDVFIAQNALWICGNYKTKPGELSPIVPTSFNLKTGEKIKTITQVLSKPMGHDRCFRNFITERFYINSKTGGPDCLDLKSNKEYPTPFTRGTCGMGVLPCNGLIYTGPFACQCSLPVILNSFNAYFTDEDSLKSKKNIVKVKRSKKFIKGPAYGYKGKNSDAPWPTFRQDERRYSGTDEKVPAKGLKQTWKMKFSNLLSAPVIADGKVFVSEVDAYTLHALDAKTGKKIWKYTTGARIDSPPTYYKGLLLFGSRDGWIHCVSASDGKLSWQFQDLPDNMICVFGRLESPWPVNGSILVKNDIAYFCAGRNSYLDGGLFIYGLDPVTGKLVHQRNFYGPYGDDGFALFVEEGSDTDKETILGTTSDVMSSEGGTLFIRHQPFTMDLKDGKPGIHLMASAGMLESKRQHREYKLVGNNFNNRKGWISRETDYPTGDIIVSDGKDYYSVFGWPVNRYSKFAPQKEGYALMAKTKSGEKWLSKWETRLELTGISMVLASDTIFIAGAPLIFEPDNLAATYEGKYGAVLLAVSAKDGTKLAEYKFDTLPAWDGMAVGYNKLYMVNQDNSIVCWGK